MRQIWLTLLMWPLIVLPISAQRAPASNVSTGFPIAPAKDGAQQIALGNSALALMGPWKFRLGDDLTWAQPSTTVAPNGFPLISIATHLRAAL